MEEDSDRKKTNVYLKYILYRQADYYISDFYITVFFH